MKRILLLIIITTFIVTGCGKDESSKHEKDLQIDNEKENENEDISLKEDVEVQESSNNEENELTIEENEEKEEVKQGNMQSVEEYKALIIPNIGADDTLESVKLDGNDIIINLTLGDPNPLSYENLATFRYSSITDKLLELNNNLNDITVNFTNVGTITMNTNEKVTSEYGSYFEGLTVEERLK